jgi:DNA (cytosine-5)-methyltransferase 1
MSTLLSVKETSFILNLSVQRVRELCRDGKIDANKIGSSWAVESDCLCSYGITAGNTLAEDHATYKISPVSKPIALSFFSGAMGLDLGLEDAGFDIMLACEVDKFCRQTIELNKPDIALLGDLNNYCASEILDYANLEKNADIDLIVGGPHAKHLVQQVSD